MANASGRGGFDLRGRRSYQWRCLSLLTGATVTTSLRRLVRGPRRPGWSWGFETTMAFLKAQGSYGARLEDPNDSREFEDALTFRSPSVPRVAITPDLIGVRGRWFEPLDVADPDAVVLYLHGGGYAYSARAHDSLIANVALATGLRVYAVDYRLAPEHRYPAQLEDARAAYARMLAEGVLPERIIVAGDSAGGNLALALLIDLRDSGEPLPAAAVCLAPWTDLTNAGASMLANEPYDWIDKAMADKWARAFCGDVDAADPRVSPVNAELSGLPPIYIQAGDAEILIDQIRAFCQAADAQGADVRLTVWKNMTHVFQAFGDELGEAQEALADLGRFVRDRLERAARAPA